MNRWIWIFNWFCPNMGTYIIVSGDKDKANEHMLKNYNLQDFASIACSYDRGMELVKKHNLKLLKEINL